tara:strand:- start:575 stop:955 length:381 start_codon:yes stop_codon:yes gene_type:complete
MKRRLSYLTKELEKQKAKLDSHKEQIGLLKDSRVFNEKGIKYNQGWVTFHLEAIEKHKEQIKADVGDDQVSKLNFHIEQIENHHKENISYHKKEICTIDKWIKMHRDSIPSCDEQIKFLQRKINNL